MTPTRDQSRLFGTPSRRNILSAGAAALGSAVLPRIARAQQQPVRLIVGFAPGGGVDVQARMVANAFQAALGRTVIVDNRPGAGSMIGVRATIEAPSDGTVALYGAGPTMVIGPAVYRVKPYDPHTDLTPVARTSVDTSVFVVRKDLPAQTVSEFVKWAKASPTGVTFGSSGTGGGPHLRGQQLSQILGVKGLHIPYRGGAPALSDLVAGRFDFMIDALSLVRAQVEAGAIRALAIIGQKRNRLLPDVPTMVEAGLPEMGEAGAWMGVFLPPRTPASIVDEWSNALKRGMSDPELLAKMTASGSDPAYLPPAEFAKFFLGEADKWKDIAAKANISID